MTPLSALTDYSVSTLILFAVIGIKVVLSRVVDHDPLRYFRFYCDRLAEKVNNEHNSPGQQRIAGGLALTITLLPLLIILKLFESFIEVPWLWHGILLYLAVINFNLPRIGKSVALALSANQTYKAKTALAPLLLRQSDSLSSMGLSKATIEMLLLRYAQQLVCVVFYYLLIGPLAALSIRLLLEMHYSWNNKCQRFQHFGVVTNKLIALLQWLPLRIFSVLQLLLYGGQHFTLYWRLLIPYFFRLNNNLPIYGLALILGLKLGGVAMYDNEKRRRASFNDQGRQPEPRDIVLALRCLHTTLYFSAAILFLPILTSQLLALFR